MKKYIAEFIGTFMLVLFGTGAIIVNDSFGGIIGHPGIALSFGLIVTIMIYTFGETSGAHMNPAVSLGLWLGKQFPSRDLIPYILSQSGGAILASLCLYLLFPHHKNLGATLPSGAHSASFLVECLFTFLLMFIILILTNGNEQQKKSAGIIIGLVILMEALVGGPISGASMNPVRSLAPALISGNLSALWIYLSAPCLGAIIAVGTWKIFR